MGQGLTPLVQYSAHIGKIIMIKSWRTKSIPTPIMPPDRVSLKGLCHHVQGSRSGPSAAGGLPCCQNTESEAQPYTTPHIYVHMLIRKGWKHTRSAHGFSKSWVCTVRALRATVLARRCWHLCTPAQSLLSRQKGEGDELPEHPYLISSNWFSVIDKVCSTLMPLYGKWKCRYPNT